MERILFSLTSEPLTTLVAPLVTCDSSSFSSAPHVYLYRPPLLRSNLLRRPTARPKLPSVSPPPPRRIDSTTSLIFRARHRVVGLQNPCRLMTVMGRPP